MRDDDRSWKVEERVRHERIVAPRARQRDLWSSSNTGTSPLAG
jgi:hypothetical protein